jgi:hypothetical protein
MTDNVSKVDKVQNPSTSIMSTRIGLSALSSTQMIIVTLTRRRFYRTLSLSRKASPFAKR